MWLLLLLLFGPIVYAALQASAVNNTIDTYRKLGMSEEELQGYLDGSQGSRGQQEAATKRETSRQWDAPEWREWWRKHDATASTGRSK